jgi:hypothetical protein
MSRSATIGERRRSRFAGKVALVTAWASEELDRIGAARDSRSQRGGPTDPAPGGDDLADPGGDDLYVPRATPRASRYLSFCGLRRYQAAQACSLSQPARPPLSPANLRRAAGVLNEGRSARRAGVRWGGHGRSCSIWAVTLSNENGSSRSWPCPHPPPALSGRLAPAMADRRGAASLWSGPCEGSGLAEHGELAGGIPRRGSGRARP